MYPLDLILHLLLAGIRWADAGKPVRGFSTQEEALVLAVRSARPGWLVVDGTDKADCTDKVAGALAVVARLQNGYSSRPGVNAARVDKKEDAFFELVHAHPFSKAAMVSEKNWQAWLARLMNVEKRGEVGYFDLNQRGQALEWIQYGSLRTTEERA